MRAKWFAVKVPTRWKTPLVLTVQAGLLAVIAATFWWQEWQYLRPTPRPIDLQQPALGTPWQPPVQIAGVLPRAAGKPVLLHFFNPGCPCSRFNVDHVRTLKREYGQDMRFVAVLQGAAEAPQLRAQFERLNLDFEVVCDTTGALAQSLGVYATPQAVLLDAESQIYYRGNYNVSRYCSDRRTEFARIAIACLLSHRPAPELTTLATTAYGCQLPTARRNPR